jgi:hypothetical protein
MRGKKSLTYIYGCKENFNFGMVWKKMFTAPCMNGKKIITKMPEGKRALL